MCRLAFVLGIALLMILPACAMRDSEVSQRELEQRPVAAGEPAAARQAAEQQEAQEAAEFMGVAPKVEDISETLVLEAKNGNVTFSHRKHAQTIDCATCHQGASGPISGFDKDKAHALCIGCHKEQKAGPAKCNECHKRS